jgi:hypothetical protein
MVNKNNLSVIKKQLKERLHFAGNQKHFFHIVTVSPWPFFASIGALMLTVGAVMYFHSYEYGFELMLLGFLLIICIMYVW